MVYTQNNMDNALEKTIKLAKQGDSAAAEDLLKQYKPMTDSAVASFLPTLSASGYTDEDLRQDVAISIIRAVNTFDFEKGVTFGAYARRCVRNGLISLCRRQARRVKLAQEREMPGEEEKGYSLKISEGFENALTEYEREVYSLYMKAYKPHEIASILGREVKSVYNALCRIRQKAKG